jgi:hypothetical protein
MLSHVFLIRRYYCRLSLKKHKGLRFRVRVPKILLSIFILQHFKSLLLYYACFRLILSVLLIVQNAWYIEKD